MADVNHGLGRQRQQAAHRPVQLVGVAAGEVGACAAHVGHEEGVAHEHRAVPLVGHVGRRVPRHPQCGGQQCADGEDLAIFEEVVGSLLFGIGCWGMAGFCPGPALAAPGMGQAKALVFVAAMLAGRGVFELLERRRPRATA